MDDPGIPLWQTLTTADLPDFMARDPVAVLPLAAIEQHGPHLPLSTDLEIGMGLLTSAFRHLPGDFPARVLPPQAAGASGEHASFAGTLDLGERLLVDAVVRQGRAVARAGIRRLVLSNSHGGNRAAMDEAGLILRRACGLLVVKVTYTRLGRPPSVDLPEAEWTHGFHGGALETAMMLHLRPDLVRVDRLDDFPSLGLELDPTLRRLLPEGQAAFSWLAEDLHPSGAAGDPRQATASLGRKLVEHYGRALADVIQDAREFPIERMAPGRDVP